MAKKREIYSCSKCDMIFEALTDGTTAECCVDEMQILVGNTQEASLEKHVPVIEKTDGGYKVMVGSIPHPMEEAHYIQWIELNEGDKAQIKFMSPGQEPVAEFKSEASEVSAREYCNLHGLWKTN